MGDITQALRSAQSGLLANQTALNIVSQNVANVNTPGYSRKIIQQQSVVLAGQGAGVSIASYSRVVDGGLIKTIRTELGELNHVTVKESYYQRLQETFGAPGDNTSIAHILEEFKEAAELLSVSPDRILEQSELVRQAQSAVEKFAAMSRTIQDLRLQADQQITAVVSEMNQLTADIDQLNDDIIRFGSTGNDTTDLEDQRDNKIDRLSELVDIRFFSRNDGDVVVFTSSGLTLVDTIPPTITHESAAAMSSTSTVASGQIDGIYVGERLAINDLTTQARGGQLAGLLDMRDDVLPNLQAQLDELAAQLRDQINLVHNRGTPFPGHQELTGQRIFTLPQEQTISFANSSDSVLVLTDSDGNETLSIRMSQLLDDDDNTGAGDTTDPVYGQVYGDGEDYRGGITITELAARLEDFFQLNGAPSASVTLNDQSQLSINLNNTSLGFGFRDESGTADGSDFGDASIEFDKDGDGTVDETIAGFSSFFGLNNLFVDGLAENIYDSNVLSSNFVSTSAVLSFRDANTPDTGSGPEYLGHVVIPAGATLQQIADLINNGGTDTSGMFYPVGAPATGTSFPPIENITASVVPDGSGFRLRIAHDDGRSFTVTHSASPGVAPATAGTTLISELGLKESDVRASTAVSVRSDIVAAPSLVSSGRLEFDASKGQAGEYLTSPGSNGVASELSAMLSNSNSFAVSGGLPSLNVSFSEYASSIIARSSSLSDTNDRQIDSQRTLTESLQFKSDSIRGVNLDEELADLIVFEQAFSAAARVISVIQEMIDRLEQAVA
ncbi:flagellar hook-associated protein FlgK [Thalassospiraceae bacterium LMO-SO8]|nr:flagellar hook-associated protein FlgK [Alphaproteobacteria bacterium LMO-S08]WND74990.1 flagellar hook-associated protein FlgK [Thalassospiraceae bacterium LMO-SO8]